MITFLIFHCFYHHHSNADVVMKFLIYHCFYNYFSNQTFVVHIDDLMKMLIFCWFYIYYWIVQHSNSMSFLLFSSALRSRLGAPKSSQDARRVPNAPSSRCYRLSLDHIKHTLYLGSRAGISDIKKHLFGVLRWDNVYICMYILPGFEPMRIYVYITGL